MMPGGEARQSSQTASSANPDGAFFSRSDRPEYGQRHLTAPARPMNGVLENQAASSDTALVEFRKKHGFSKRKRQFSGPSAEVRCLRPPSSAPQVNAASCAPAAASIRASGPHDSRRPESAENGRRRFREAPALFPPNCTSSQDARMRCGSTRTAAGEARRLQNGRSCHHPTTRPS